MNPITDFEPVPSAPKAHRSAVRLVGAAVAWGFVLLILATALPIVTPQAPPSFAPPPPSASPDGAGTPALPPPASGPAPAIVRVPQVTLVHYYGHSVLLLVALPAFASFVVGLMLWMSVAKRSRAAGIEAWIVAVIVLAAGIIGFFTFLFTIGLAIVPIGVLLIIACSRAAPLAHSQTGVV